MYRVVSPLEVRVSCQGLMQDRECRTGTHNLNIDLLKDIPLK